MNSNHIFRKSLRVLALLFCVVIFATLLCACKVERVQSNSWNSGEQELMKELCGETLPKPLFENYIVCKISEMYDIAAEALNSAQLSPEEEQYRQTVSSILKVMSSMLKSQEGVCVLIYDDVSEETMDKYFATMNNYRGYKVKSETHKGETLEYNFFEEINGTDTLMHIVSFQNNWKQLLYGISFNAALIFYQLSGTSRYSASYFSDKTGIDSKYFPRALDCRYFAYHEISIGSNNRHILGYELSRENYNDFLETLQDLGWMVECIYDFSQTAQHKCYINTDQGKFCMTTIFALSAKEVDTEEATVQITKYPSGFNLGQVSFDWEES